jgi:DNA-damage-inducible protein D
VPVLPAYICRESNPEARNREMKQALIRRLHKNFEDYVHVKDGVEFWFARDLQNLLGYAEWRNFLKIIEKARESCKNANNTVLDHFVDANKSIPVPKGG